MKLILHPWFVIWALVASGCSSDQRAQPSQSGGGAGAANQGGQPSGGTDGGSTNEAGGVDSLAGTSGVAGTHIGNGGSAGATSSSAASAGNIGVGGTGSTCEYPASIEAPDSNYSNGAIDIAFANAASGVGLLYPSDSDYAPLFSIYNPGTQTFDSPRKLTVAGQVIKSGFRRALTVLPDGRFAAGWCGSSRCYISVAPDTDPTGVKLLSAIVRQSMPITAMAPFFDGRVALAWQEIASNSTTHYYATLDIYDPDTATEQLFTIEVPNTVNTTPRLYFTTDRLIVVLTQTVPFESGDTNPAAIRNFFVAEIGPNDTPGTITAKAFISNSRASDAPLLIDANRTRVAYASSSLLQVADLDTDFNLVGAATTIMPWKTNTDLIVLHDATGDYLLYNNRSDGIHYAKLDASMQPITPIAQLSTADSVPRAYGLANTSAGMVAVWNKWLGSVYVTPLCP